MITQDSWNLLVSQPTHPHFTLEFAQLLLVHFNHTQISSVQMVLSIEKTKKSMITSYSCNKTG